MDVEGEKPALDSTGRLKPAILFDRDGVLNVDHRYVFRVKDLELTAAAGRAVKIANDAGYMAIVISNQSGIARGLFSRSDVECFHDALRVSLRPFGAHIDAFYYCPYHPDGVVPELALEHFDRKPQPGMIIRAIADWSLDPNRTTLIGDKESDVSAAAAAGIRGILVPPNLTNLDHIVREALECRSV
jgi:D-glycero-D-manno-heptose 1,7-bisphosphate phosphatase